MKNPRWRRWRWVLAFGVVAAVAAGVYVKTHPLIFNESFFSHAHCITMVGIALQNEAGEHGGNLPTHPNGYGDALLALTNWVGGYYAALSGPGYPDDAFREAVRSGGDVDERRCGRVYVQGLSAGMDVGIAVLFDKVPTPGGDHCHFLNRLTAPLGREVWTLGNSVSFVPVSIWPAFASNQVNLLVQAGISRTEAERLYHEELRRGQ